MDRRTRKEPGVRIRIVVASLAIVAAALAIPSAAAAAKGPAAEVAGGVTRTVASTSSRNDIALMRLSNPVSTTYMSLSSSYPPVNSTTSLYGWGMTCYSGCDASPVLKSASVRVTSTYGTDAYSGRAIASTAIDGYAWRGDSGGPQV
jgi:hypothetical protein